MGLRIAVLLSTTRLAAPWDEGAGGVDIEVRFFSPHPAVTRPSISIVAAIGFMYSLRLRKGCNRRAGSGAGS
jgi:hypothetical protein